MTTMIGPRTTLLATALALIPVFAFAQQALPPVPEVIQAQTPGIVNCFDYYRFGSVQAHVTSSVTNTVSGAPVTFSGTLENQNPYPITDGALYVKIFRDRSAAKDSNGPDVVAQFLVKGDIVIPAMGSAPVSFAWNVPSYAASGEYRVATFFTTARKFNLLGLSFTDDVTGSTVPFRVVGEQSARVQFDRSSVTVGGARYTFAAFPPHTSNDAPVTIKASVTNSGAQAESASISWEVYQWDAQLRQSVVQEEPRSLVVVPAHQSAPVSLVVSDTRYPVYLAVGTLTWHDTTSVIQVRFVRDGIDRARINFPGVLSYPLKAGQENTLFSCLHNTGASAFVSGGRLELTVSDMQGNVIDSYTYTGDVTSSMMGVAHAFTPTKDYGSFVLDARLYQGATYVDEAHITYDCNDLDPRACTQDSSMGWRMSSMDVTNPVLWAGALLLLVLLVSLLLITRWIRRASRVPDGLPTNNMTS